MTTTTKKTQAAKQKPCACGPACRCGENCTCTAARSCSPGCACASEAGCLLPGSPDPGQAGFPGVWAIVIELRIIETTSPIYPSQQRLRDEVLRKPLGRQLSAADIDRDRAGAHFVAVREGEVVACVGLYPDGPGKVRLRQMAVSPALQGQGVGLRVLTFAEDWRAGGASSRSRRTPVFPRRAFTNAPATSPRANNSRKSPSRTSPCASASDRPIKNQGGCDGDAQLLGVLAAFGVMLCASAARQRPMRPAMKNACC
ncbi:MAG: GNAT family N-acetyltransferase [Alphaproteobacteria bacterium]